MEKTCCRCKETKSVSEFYKCARNANGLHGACKSCLSTAAKARRPISEETRKQRALEAEALAKGMRACFRCKAIKPLDDFRPYNGRTDKKHSWCKPCCNSWDREYYHKNKNKFQQKAKLYRKKYPDKVRNSMLSQTYGISLEDWNSLFVAQGSQCKVCGADTPRGNKFWHTDHNHETGRVRGILCSTCNQTIGFVERNLVSLFSLIEHISEGVVS
jgi:Recombination endonuclease VII